MATYNTGLSYWFTTQITGELGMVPDTALALRKVYGDRFTRFTASLEGVGLHTFCPWKEGNSESSSTALATAVVTMAMLKAVNVFTSDSLGQRVT